MGPITSSLLEADFYKFTMAQVVWACHRDVPVRYAFTNRTKDVRMADIVPVERLREELAHVRTLRFTADELEYLKRAGGVFSDRFLSFLSGVRLPEIDVQVRDGQFSVVTEGPWSSAIFWETIVLNIVNELYFEQLVRQDGLHAPSAARTAFFAEGRRRLREKISRVVARPELRIMEFGNRRHFSSAWHEAVLEELIDGLPPAQLLGTSNVALARKFGIRPSGTFAHEMFMVYSGIYHGSDEEIRGSHNRVLRDWRHMYGDKLSIALTDTYGSEFFFRDMSEEQAREWVWLRHDSGDPFVFGGRAVGFYRGLGIDPSTKGIVYSDGLTIDVIERLDDAFTGAIKFAFGWGTNLTNDLGYRPLSLVMKAVSSCGHPTVKLSDNPAKATGPADEIERFKRIFGYVEGERRECVY